jgi:acetylornithine deacetylase/succinyl-diaminopimelate desuccinylase-like protein
VALAVPILAALAALSWLPGPPGAAAAQGSGEPDLSPAARRLQAYVQVDTSNPPGNEKAGALYLKRLLDEAGIASEIHEASPGRASIYARLPPPGI